MASEARPLRADARRNREAILAAAEAVFEAEGVLASLDAIALKAGVGNATLYRNFPTREDLLAAVMDSGIAAARAEAAALQAQPPREALAAWLVWLSWRLRIWHDLPHCIATARGTTASGAPDTAMNPAIAALMEATQGLLAHAQAAGSAQPAVTAAEAFELVTALSWAIDRFGDDEAAAKRRVEIGTAGLFASTPSAAAAEAAR